jgi:hypothetical protein
MYAICIQGKYLFKHFILAKTLLDFIQFHLFGQVILGLEDPTANFNNVIIKQKSITIITITTILIFLY